jgi:hypothetical protein
MNKPQDDERLVEQLVRAGTAPNPNAVAAGADGQRHRPEVARLDRDPEAVLLLRVLARERSRKRRVLWGGGALAACVLAGLLLFVPRGDEARPPRASLGERLLAAVAALKGEDPLRFGSFALAAEEDLAATSGVMRGGAAWLAPRGTLWSPPRTLRWRRPDGMGRVALTLKGPGVNWQQEVEGDAVDAPPLRSGRFVVTLRVLDGLAGQTIRRSFVVADDAQRAAYEDARTLWKSRTRSDLHDLLEAHYAYAAGFFERALDAARRADAAGVNTRELVQPLLRHLER